MTTFTITIKLSTAEYYSSTGRTNSHCSSFTILPLW